MNCQKCNSDFNESYIEESHDVPCYLFEGKFRNERKQQADKYPRHNLCKDCHHKYESDLKMLFREKALEYSKQFFGGNYGN